MGAEFRVHASTLLAAAALAVTGVTAAAQPVMSDPALQVGTVVSGLSVPSGLAFLGANDVLVTERNTGRVRRVVNGAVTATVLDLAVNSSSERGLLGIALDADFATNKFVYLFWTESSTGADSSAVDSVALLSNRVDRFVWNGAAQTLTLAANVIRLRALQNDANSAASPGTPTPQGNHNGGKLAVGPDKKLYVYVGDVGRRGWMQNISAGLLAPGVDDSFGGPLPDNAHLTGVILRLNLDGTAPSDNPFYAAGAGIGGEVGANIQKVYSYGHSHGSGLAFDPISGRLWNADRGDDSFDEINRVVAGGNYGWVRAMGPVSRVAQFKAIEAAFFTPGGASSTGNLQQLRFPVSSLADTPAAASAALFALPGSAYQDPELSWRYAVEPAGLGFVQGSGLGARYAGTLWTGQARAADITGGTTGTFAGGALMMVRLTGDRLHVDSADDARLADRVVDNGAAAIPPPGTPASTAGYKFDGRESESLLIGQGFGAISAIQTAPDGSVYVVSSSNNAVYRVSRTPTPPVIVPTVIGTKGGNGVYTSNVVVSWSVTDAFPIIVTNGCGVTNLTADTPGTTLTCSATNAAGLTTTASVTIAIDQHFIDVPPTPGTLGAIPDAPSAGVPGAPRDVKFTVTGMPHVGLVAVSMTFSPAHTASGDLVASLIAPDGTTHVLFSRPGTTNDLAGPYVFRDTATNDFRTAAVAGSPVTAGTYRTSTAAGLTVMNAVLANGRSGNGTWTLRFVDQVPGNVGSVAAATVSLAPSLPTNLRVDAIVGTQVRLRWDAPAGVTPTGYVIEGGLAPDAPIAAVATGSAAPVLDFTAPAGTYWLRVRYVEGAFQSLPSTDTRLNVTLAPPSPPDRFTAAVAGSALNLSWKPTYTGGVPADIVADVSGIQTGSASLGLTDALVIPQVPPGTYTLSLRAVNAGGSSAGSAPITITVPTACTGVPNPPENIVFFRVGNVLSLLWDAPSSGAAPLDYVLDVTGTYTGALAVGGRAFSAPAPPATYTIRVLARNACGTSAPSVPQTVVVP